MSSSVERWLLVVAAALAVATGGVQAQARYPGIGRAATPAEVKAWDIDVRPDFKGLPPGSGTVARGQGVWEAKCASCHGVFGEANSVFNPLVGGTTQDDIRTGRVAALQREDYPGRTTLMKVPTVSTLWDYINRAMPWNQPKSLSVEEVYSVVAYVLNLADVVPADFTLSDKNIADVQKRMPNRNGVTTAHAMWPGDTMPGTVRNPDAKGDTCVKNCAVDPKVTSLLPAFAQNAHGNLSEQNRNVGAQRGVNTADPSAGKPPEARSGEAVAVAVLMQKNQCSACHAMDRRVVGPSWSEIAQKHTGKAEYLESRVRQGSSGEWGTVPMPAQSADAESVKRIAQWLAAGAKP